MCTDTAQGSDKLLSLRGTKICRECRCAVILSVWALAFFFGTLCGTEKTNTCDSQIGSNVNARRPSSFQSIIFVSLSPPSAFHSLELFMSEAHPDVEERDPIQRVNIKYSETSPRCCYINKNRIDVQRK